MASPYELMSANNPSTFRRLRAQAVVEANCVDGMHLTTVAVVTVDVTVDVMEVVAVKK